jgi:hypothetical protein
MADPCTEIWSSGFENTQQANIALYFVIIAHRPWRKGVTDMKSNNPTKWKEQIRTSPSSCLLRAADKSYYISYFHFQGPRSLSFRLFWPCYVPHRKHGVWKTWLDGHWPATDIPAKEEFPSLVLAECSGSQPVKPMPAVLVDYPKVLTFVPTIQATTWPYTRQKNKSGGSGVGGVSCKMMAVQVLGSKLLPV